MIIPRGADNEGECTQTLPLHPGAKFGLLRLWQSYVGGSRTSHGGDSGHCHPREYCYYTHAEMSLSPLLLPGALVTGSLCSPDKAWEPVYVQCLQANSWFIQHKGTCASPRPDVQLGQPGLHLAGISLTILA